MKTEGDLADEGSAKEIVIPARDPPPLVLVVGLARLWVEDSCRGRSGFIGLSYNSSVPQYTRFRLIESLSRLVFSFSLVSRCSLSLERFFLLNSEPCEEESSEARRFTLKFVGGGDESARLAVIKLTGGLVSMDNMPVFALEALSF